MFCEIRAADSSHPGTQMQSGQAGSGREHKTDLGEVQVPPGGGAAHGGAS